MHRPGILSRPTRSLVAGAIAAALALGLLTALGLHTAFASTGAGPAAPALPRAPEGVPVVLAPPAGNVRALVLPARGVQVYRCTGGSWAFVEPAAALGRPGRGTGVVHFRGPSWESVEDGSLVEAAPVATSPVPGSIPQLLLKTSTTRSAGLLGRVTYVQRLATAGGAAPAGACTDGTTTGVRYRADYAFWVAR